MRHPQARSVIPIKSETQSWRKISLCFVICIFPDQHHPVSLSFSGRQSRQENTWLKDFIEESTWSPKSQDCHIRNGGHAFISTTQERNAISLESFGSWKRASWSLMWRMKSVTPLTSRRQRAHDLARWLWELGESSQTHSTENTPKIWARV